MNSAVTKPQQDLSDSLRNRLSQVEGLSLVEELMRTKFVSDAPLLAEIPSYLLGLGGKRIRPILCLLSGQLFGMRSPTPEIVDVCAGIELIHMATLLHDDIIDKSTIRRHKESPFKKFGVASTLLAGDFLLTRAFSLCAKLDHFVINATENACIELTEGEILEVPLCDQDHSVESCLTIARKKTASLFQLSTATGSHIAGASDEATHRMEQFGLHLGVAFQVLDDILDAVADEDLLGKPSGLDIVERKPSIINVLWLSSGSDKAQVLKREIDFTDFDLHAALNEIRGSSVVHEARSIAEREAKLAREHLDAAAANVDPALRSEETLALLHALIEFTIQRLS